MRIDQGVPRVRSITDRKRKTIPDVHPTPEVFPTLIVALSRNTEVLEKILDKLEAIRYAMVDNETGLSNLLKQSKVTNKKLEELLDKRN